MQNLSATIDPLDVPTMDKLNKSSVQYFENLADHEGNFWISGAGSAGISSWSNYVGCMFWTLARGANVSGTSLVAHDYAGNIATVYYYDITNSFYAPTSGMSSGRIHTCYPVFLYVYNATTVILVNPLPDLAISPILTGTASLTGLTIKSKQVNDQLLISVTGAGTPASGSIVLGTLNATHTALITAPKYIRIGVNQSAGTYPSAGCDGYILVNGSINIVGTKSAVNTTFFVNEPIWLG